MENKLLDSDIDAINSIFLDQQIHSLRLSDQRSLLDSLSQNSPKTIFNVGDYAIFKKKEYWVEEINDNTLMLRNDDDLLFRPQSDKELIKTDKNRLVEQAKLLIASNEKQNNNSFELRKISRELKHVNGKDFSSFKGSKVQILPHQINAVYQVMNSLKHRFLIADEVGLGKTIEFGLLLKEFSMRYHYNKIIIIVPASLQLQWQCELSEKFDEEFIILDKKSIQKSKKKNINSFLKDENKIIVSLDFAKQTGISPHLSSIIWDMVVFDEAHRLKRDRTNITQVYKFAESIAYKTKSFFLLSATPFSGKIEELYFLTHLLDKDKSGSLNTFLNEYYNKGAKYLNKLLSDMVIRRTKKEVGGFTKRFAATIKYKLSHTEKTFYDTITEYIRTEYNSAMKINGGIRALMLTCFLKMLDSSMASILSAINSRMNILQEKIDKLNGETKKIENAYKEYNYLEEDGEEELSTIADTDKLTIDELIKERLFLSNVYKLGQTMGDSTKEARLVALIKDIKQKNKKEKIIIFTQFKATMYSLEKALSQYKTLIFHGSMNRDEKDRTIESFKLSKEILISTEAGGEGRNLQFARIMINYDLPWNPFKIEQRIGRIHRFGQKSDVYIYNFAVEESIGARVIEIITEKINIFEDAFGETETLIGQTDTDGKAFEKVFRKMYLEGKDALKDIEMKLNISKEKLNKLAISNHYFQKANISAETVKKEIAVLAEKLETFFELYSSIHPEDYTIIGKITIKNKKVYQIRGDKKYFKKPNVTFDFSLSQTETHKLQNGEPLDMDYLHLEHPLIKYMITKCNSNAMLDAVGKKKDFVTKISFSFLVSLNYYIKEEKYITISTPFKSDINKSYKNAITNLEKKVQSIKENIIKKNKPLIEQEVIKIKEVFLRQEEELQSILENYQFKNKQTEKDNYFLLIPKVKKNLKTLKSDYDSVINITKNKTNIHYDYFLDSIELN